MYYSVGEQVTVCNRAYHNVLWKNIRQTLEPDLVTVLKQPAVICNAAFLLRNLFQWILKWALFPERWYSIECKPMGIKVKTRLFAQRFLFILVAENILTSMYIFISRLRSLLADSYFVSALCGAIWLTFLSTLGISHLLIEYLNSQ